MDPLFRPIDRAEKPGESEEPGFIPMTPAAILGHAPFSWELHSVSPPPVPPPVPPKIPIHRPTTSPVGSQGPFAYVFSHGSQLLKPREDASLDAIDLGPPIRVFTQNMPKYSLPKSYERDFRVVRDIGEGAFGQTAVVEVVSAEEGGIAHGFRLPVGMSFVAKKVQANPARQKSLYRAEWRILDILRGHRNILYGMCTQQPRKESPHGHIFTEYCDLGDILRLLQRYDDNFRTKMRECGFSRAILPPELRWLECPPEGIAYEIMTSVARGIAWMHHGIWDWPLHSEMNPKWTPIMHNDLKANNIFMISRRQGDPCPYPIFKIGDFGAATSFGMKAWIGNNATSSPQRMMNCLSIPSVPADDIFALGAMMYNIAHCIYPYEGKFGETSAGAEAHKRPTVQHRVRTPT
ncbi:G2-specific serine/threonine protein kinase [Orbilia blumenaviensis]|uniref:Autophagy-related protein 1 n=1 Tax=Orbilia blumenaviensis TaxID=1796055 RepID=A0AAV9VJC1_9PEZI